MSDDKDNVVDFKKRTKKTEMSSQEYVAEFLNNVELDSLTLVGSIQGFTVWFTECPNDLVVVQQLHDVIESLMLGDMDDVGE